MVQQGVFRSTNFGQDAEAALDASEERVLEGGSGAPDSLDEEEGSGSGGNFSPRSAQLLVRRACGMPLSAPAMNKAGVTERDLLDCVQVGPIHPFVQSAFLVFQMDNDARAGAELIDTMVKARKAGAGTNSGSSNVTPTRGSMFQ